MNWKDTKVKLNGKDSIETPENTTAKYVCPDHTGNRIFYDGVVFWVIDKNDKIVSASKKGKHTCSK